MAGDGGRPGPPPTGAAVPLPPSGRGGGCLRRVQGATRITRAVSEGGACCAELLPQVVDRNIGIAVYRDDP